MSVCARAPGLETSIMRGDMAFEFPAGPFGAHARGYERPLRDAMLGDPFLFPSAKFVEQGWRLVQPLLDAWWAAAPSRSQLRAEITFHTFHSH
jgi:glucose-6-phosphate 1-dehydrogenase